MTINTISPSDLKKLQQENPALEVLDVRTPVEFREVHLACARNTPLDRLNPKDELPTNGASDQPVYLICRSGKRGEKACQMFVDQGFENVVNVEGGTEACVSAGLAVVRGKKAMSLERQVRIAAGFLVLVGAILGLVVHPAFVGLSAFVGAGLMFAGITDTCAMGMLIAKMPWNQVKTSCTT